MVLLVAFGNPLLDINVQISSTGILEKYKLNHNDQREFEHKDMTQLLEDIKEYSFTYSAGGCAQNTARIFQLLENVKDSTEFYGAIGNDEQGRILTQMVETDGVKTRYSKLDSVLTGTSVGLISGDQRSLVAHLGAAELFELDNINVFQQSIDNGSLFYMEGFFITKREHLANWIVDEIISKNKEFAFNLCGTYLCQEPYFDTLQCIALKSNFIFGNRDEFEAFRCLYKGGSMSFEEFVFDIAQGTPNKVVVITNGDKYVLLIQNNIMEKIPVLRVDSIVDTTGAGDSFVSGFLYGYLHKLPLTQCVKLGSVVSSEIIRELGCTLSSDKLETINDQFVPLL